MKQAYKSTMRKDITKSIRIDKSVNKKLNRLAKRNKSGISETIRLLIEKEYESIKS